MTFQGASPWPTVSRRIVIPPFSLNKAAVTTADFPLGKATQNRSQQHTAYRLPPLSNSNALRNTSKLDRMAAETELRTLSPLVFAAMPAGIVAENKLLVRHPTKIWCNRGYVKAAGTASRFLKGCPPRLTESFGSLCSPPTAIRHSADVAPDNHERQQRPRTSLSRGERRVASADFLQTGDDCSLRHSFGSPLTPPSPATSRQSPPRRALPVCRSACWVSASSSLWQSPVRSGFCTDRSCGCVA